MNAETAFGVTESNITTLKGVAENLPDTVTDLDTRSTTNFDTANEQENDITELETEWLKQEIKADYFKVIDGLTVGADPMTTLDDGCISVEPGDIIEYFLNGNFDPLGNSDDEAISVQLRLNGSQIVAESGYRMDANDTLTRGFSLYYKDRCPGTKDVDPDCNFSAVVLADDAQGNWAINDKNLQIGYRIYNEEALLEATAPTC